MTSNKRLLLIGVSLVLIYVCSNSFNPLEAFTGCSAVIGLCISLLKKFPVVVTPFGNVASMNAQQKTYYDNELRTERNRKISIYIVSSLLALFWMRFVLGAACFSFFSFFDNTFRFSDGLNPVASWMLIGLLSGAAAGAFFSGKKYRLSGGFKFIPGLILVILISAFSLINKPFAAPEPVGKEVPVRDSVLVPLRAPVVANKPLKRRHRVKPKSGPVHVNADSLDREDLDKSPEQESEEIKADTAAGDN
jgi:hypothetical protein